MSTRLPIWFKQRLPNPNVMLRMHSLIAKLELNTICQSALCPNIANCFYNRTATFMILGNVCTRNCSFCYLRNGIPSPIDNDEPYRIIEAVHRLGLDYVVITSVTRDDLPDGGASQFASIINLLHKKNIRVEVLVPDFGGSNEALETLISAKPQVICHNIETGSRLYPEVRQGANYDRSMKLLFKVKQIAPEIITKSGFMLGLSETREEVINVMSDLRESGCNLLTIGQYLPPSPAHYPVVQFINPDDFLELRQWGKSMGFSAVASAPLVRSSFKATELYSEATS